MTMLEAKKVADKVSEKKGLSLQVKDVKAGYDHAQIIHGASLTVASGQLVAVVGPNGAGKSTLLKAIFGLLRVSSGDILLNGENITNAAPEALVKRGLAYVPQRDNVFPTLSVLENLEMGAYTQKQQYRARLQEIFSLFPDLYESKRRPAGHLSGGQRNMLAMARALMINPGLLLLDEPTAGLAPRVTLAVWERIEAIRDAKVAVLVVEQNTKMALERADYGYVLVAGQNRSEGLGPELLASQEIVNLYLGQY